MEGEGQTQRMVGGACFRNMMFVVVCRNKTKSMLLYNMTNLYNTTQYTSAHAPL